jgi:hypothetical protein
LANLHEQEEMETERHEEMVKERQDVIKRQQPKFPVTDYLKKMRPIDTSNGLSMSKSKSTPKMMKSSFMISDTKKNKYVKIDYHE